MNAFKVILSSFIALIISSNSGVSGLPVSTVIQTPNGPQVITREVSPDGTLLVSSNGPGHSQTFIHSGGSGAPSGYSSSSFHSSGPGSGVVMSGSSMGSGMMMGSGMGMGNGMGMGDGMMMGMAPMKPMKPMKFPKFKWWPSLFD